jgi:copper chaperone CopZ
MMKGLTPGAAFVFLVAGPATNAATITLITNVMGKRIVAVYLSVISIGALGFGYLLDFIYSLLGIDPVMHVMKHHHEEPSLFTTLFSIALLIMLLLSYFRKLKARYSQNSKNASMSSGNTGMISGDNPTTLSILGMTCNNCAIHVKEAIQSVRGVRQVDVVLQKKNAVIKGDFSLDDVKAAVKDAGYSTS